MITDALTVSGPAGRSARQVMARESTLHVPSLLSAEVCGAIRSMARRGTLSASVAQAAVARVTELRARRYPFEPFAHRAWELRDNITVYDAWYVALAEQLSVGLVTADARLRGAAGPRCPMLSPEQAAALPSAGHG